MKNEPTPTTVMLVDDTPSNLRFLQQIFRKKSYRVVAFTNGEEALNAAAKKPPEIILLDIMMPDMDGFEVCKRLKADPGLRHVPILFISALSDQGEKAHAFAAGGVDYVTKPFEEQEVLMRAETHLKLSRLTQELEKIVQERTDQLVESNTKLKQEITIRKAAEKGLRTHQALLQSVFEGISEPLLLVDRDMRVKLFNKSAAKYYKALGIELAPGRRPCHDHGGANPGPCATCNLPEVVSKGVKFTLERKCLANPNKIEQVFAYPIRKKGQKTEDVIVRIADVTEERRLQEEMAQADKLIALGTLVAGVAHEINNPNNIILLNVPILSGVWQRIAPILDDYCQTNGDFFIDAIAYSQLKEEIPKLISGIGFSAERIKRIVTVLKEYSAKSKFTLAPMAVNTAVRNSILMLSHRINKSTNAFSVAYGEGLPKLKADLQKLEQVLVNVISNALDALPDKNSGVFIKTLFDREKQQVTVEVRDEGVGIPKDSLSQIMDPFFTTKRAKGGTGLGLAIAFQIVQHHGGKINVKSKEGEGSTFRISLPTVQKMEMKKILLVDDDKGIREILRIALESDPTYLIKEAANGIEACIMIGKDPPDLLVLDAQMPDMNGAEVCRIIKKDASLSGVRVIVITGHRGSPTVREIETMGFNEILDKPFDSHVLLGSIGRLLAERNAATSQ